MQLAEALFESKKENIHNPDYADLLRAVRAFESKNVINEFLDLVYNESDGLFERKLGHMRKLADRFGDDIFILFTTEGPVHDLLDTDGVLGFENGMVALVQNPPLFDYLLSAMFERQLLYVEKAREYGAHGYSQSFSYLCADMSSPEIYRQRILPVQHVFYSEVERRGLFPILLAWGWVTPIVQYFKDAGIRGLTVEESRKSFTNDIGDIREALDDSIGLFGNVSGEHTLLHGSEQDVRDEVIRQIEKAGKRGGFISSSGTPIAFGTPPGTVHALIDAAKEFTREEDA
jgi:uroporphyrinogen-III decarboxylase